MTDRKMLPVWFFVGVLLFLYGVIILASGLWQLHRPAGVMFEDDHPAIWGGMLLLLIGGSFSFRYRPRH